MPSIPKDPTNTSRIDSADTDSERELSLLEAQHLRELGSIERTQSNYQHALQCFEHSLSIFRKYGVSASEGYVLGNIGSVYHEQGLFEQAAQCVHEGLALVRSVYDKRGEGTLLGILGNIYRSQGKHQRALDLFTQALEISQQIGDVHTEGINLGNLGCVYQAQGEYEQALQMHSQALTISQTYGDGGNEGINHGNIGDALFAMKQFEQAKQSLRLAIKIGDNNAMMTSGVFRASLALLLATQGQIEEAYLLLKESEQEVAPYAEEYAKYLVKKAQVRNLGGDIKGAKASLQQAQTLATELNVLEESEVGQAIQRGVTLLHAG
ncbi:MAG: tetratricopeptide repeat protein [Myxococcota bacterium]